MTRVISLQPEDDLAVLRYRLRQARDGRVVIVLPWDTRLFSRPLDGELVRREAERLGLEVAVVSEDPDRRAYVRWLGLPAFSSVAEAEAAREWPWPERESPEPPRRAWWEEEIPLRPPPARPLPPWAQNVRLGMRAAVFLATLLVLLAFAYAVVPQATIVLVPVGQTLRAEVTVSAGLDFSNVDPVRGLIPARRVGDYFSGYLEVETTGTAAYEAGKARGTVLFSNLLAQEVRVPVGTVVRTSSGSFPVRFATTQEIVVPPFGQAPAPIEALEEGPAGNVPAGHINQVEGIIGTALRVINPESTSGGGLQEVRAVSQEDMDRARAQLRAQLLEEAYQGLQKYLEPTEVLFRQSLEIQAAEVTFNRFLYERADTVGVQMKLLITGMAVDRGNAQVVAYRALSDRLPHGHALVDADFELHEPEAGPQNGILSFKVSAIGSTAAVIDPEAVRKAVRGRSVRQATALLAEEFPLAESPRIEVWPRWLGRLPLLPLRIGVVVQPEAKK
ncbi:MAG: baseplate J/gp47 family protein [Anaerolineae bacterium]|nr:baseplate J/gp47 family protein [Anaerolineae bacterium]MCX8068350.1 baseplate J/gp47 family protein [Anaerolineae bacterium]MDW7991690.1 baseplate J/gp47 family protein [Anaerolineae bacterium]